MKMSKIEDSLDQVKRDLAIPIPPHTLSKEKMKMAAKINKKTKADAPADDKKAKSKAAPAKAASPKDKGSDGRVSLADLAKEAKISPAAARRKVRATEIERGDGRWSWEPGSKALRTVREALGLK